MDRMPREANDCPFGVMFGLCIGGLVICCIFITGILWLG